MRKQGWAAFFKSLQSIIKKTFYILRN